MAKTSCDECGCATQFVGGNDAIYIMLYIILIICLMLRMSRFAIQRVQMQNSWNPSVKNLLKCIFYHFTWFWFDLFFTVWDYFYIYISFILLSSWFFDWPLLFREPWLKRSPKPPTSFTHPLHSKKKVSLSQTSNHKPLTQTSNCLSIHFKELTSQLTQWCWTQVRDKLLKVIMIHPDPRHNASWNPSHPNAQHYI